MQERAAGAAGAVDQILRQRLEVFAIVVVLFADDVDQPCPPSTDANHFATLAQRADGYGADGGIQAGHVAAASENSDHTFFPLHVCHFLFADVGSCPLRSCWTLSSVLELAHLALSRLHTEPKPRPKLQPELVEHHH